MIEMSFVTFTHSVTSRAIPNLPFPGPCPHRFLVDAKLPSPQTKSLTSLDSVRCTGHQQAGRLEKSLAPRRPRSTWLVRQHKDHLIAATHVIAIFIIIFRNNDGVRQIDAPFRELCSGIWRSTSPTPR